jgi:hypothetical protein
MCLSMGENHLQISESHQLVQLVTTWVVEVSWYGVDSWVVERWSCVLLLRQWTPPDTSSVGVVYAALYAAKA